MPITTIRPSVDSWTGQAKPNSNNGDAPRLRLQSTATGQGKRAYVYWGLPFLPGSGARVHWAVLRFWVANNWSGTHNLSARRITGPWQEGQITWNTAPSVSGENVAQTVVTNFGPGQYIEFDLTAMLRDVAAGAAWYGVRVESGRDENRAVWSSDAPKAKDRPEVLIVWSPPLEPVTLTAPTGGQAVGVENPTLTWQVNSPDDEFAQLASQVQINDSEDFSGAVLYDSGPRQNPLGEWSLEGEYTLQEGTRYWWRARVQGEDGEWTDWSDAQEFRHVRKGTLEILNPPAPGPGQDYGVVEDITPIYVWDYEPTDDEPELEQKQWSISVRAEVDWGDLTPRWETGWRTGSEQQFRQPSTFALIGRPVWPDGPLYRVTVRVRDGVDRAHTPGDPPWVEAERVFKVERSALISPPTSLTVTSDGPAVILEWEEESAADEFAITRDGEYVLWSILAEETRVEGNKHRLRLYAAIPGREHTWGVERVIHTEHPQGLWIISEHSEPVTAQHKLEAVATWLVDPDDETVVEIYEVEGRQSGFSRELHEVSEVHETRGGELVQITDAVGRWKGRVDGQLIKPADSQALIELRRRTKPLRLIAADTNALVVVRNVKHEQAPLPNNTVWDVGFEWFEVRPRGDQG